MADPRKPLGNTIRRLREEANLTQEQLAERADMHWTYVSGIERGVYNVSILKLARIAAGLKVHINGFVEEPQILPGKLVIRVRSALNS